MKGHSSGPLGLLGLAGAVALFFLIRHFFPSLAGTLLSIAGLALLGIILLVVLAVFFAFRKPKPKQGQEKAEYAAAMLAQGRSNLLELRQLTMRVRDRQIHGASEEICRVVEQILSALKEQPESVPQVRRLFNYYLPTFSGILQKYIRLEQNGVPAADTTQKVTSGLDSIQTAMEKLHANLFEADNLDLTVEMETLEQICKQDGLLEEGSVQTQDDDQNITLSL